MCSNCAGDYENPDATANVPLCECGHDVELHDSRGCTVGMGTRGQCRCRRPIEQLLFGVGISQAAIITQEEINFLMEAQRVAQEVTAGLHHSIDSDTLQCSCGAGICFECAAIGRERCTKECGGHHDR